MKKNKLVFQPLNCLDENDIRHYLSGELEESARYRIENHLLDCPLCEEAVEGYATEYDFAQDDGLDQLKNLGKEKSGQLDKYKKTRMLTLNRIAAVILFLIISSAAIFYWNAQNNKTTFLSDFQSSDNGLEGVRGTDVFSIENELKEGVEFYRNNQYSESLLFFENSLESDPENATSHYFIGLAALKLGELDNAIENLSFARFNSENYYEDATWHLILANIDKRNIVEAKALIEDLLKIEGGFYYDKAEKLSKEL